MTAMSRQQSSSSIGKGQGMKRKCEISIIMAAYNAERTVQRAIESVLAQSYQNYELLVINDCSTDRTVEVVQTFLDERIRLIQNERNMGVSYTRKHGLDEARGEWIAVLDSDDAWMPDKLEKQVQLQKTKNAELIFTGSSFMNSNGDALDWVLHVPKTMHYRQLLKQNLISNSSVLVRKRLYAQYYTAGDQMHEDLAIWLKILKCGIMAYGIDEPLLIYRLTEHSKSSNKLKAAQMNWNTYRAVGLNVLSALYYECWYIIRGLLKYSHLK